MADITLWRSGAVWEGVSDVTGGSTGSRLRSSRFVVLVSLLVLAVGLAACGVQDKAEPAKGASQEPKGAPKAAAAVGWAGNGRYALVQFPESTKVGVYDTATGTGRIVEGFRLIGAERAAARAWLVPDDGVVTAADVFGDAIDSLPPQLFAWDLSDLNNDPDAEVESRWKKWEGPGTYDAFVEISVIKGGSPNRVFLNNKKQQGDGFKASLPEGVSTFEPVGFSPSGDFFAAVSVLGTKDGAPEGDQLAMIFSAADGSCVASAPIGMAEGLGTPAVWAPGRDVLLAARTKDGKSLLIAVAPGKPEQPADKAGLVLPADLGSATNLGFLGMDGDKPVVTDGAKVWTIGADGTFADSGAIEAVEAAFGKGGLLVIKGEGDAAEVWLSELGGEKSQRLKFE